MLLLKTLEYLFYLVIFILMTKFAEAAPQQQQQQQSKQMQPQIEDSTVATPATSTSSSSSSSSAAAAAAAGAAAMKYTALDECQTTFSWMCLKIEFVKLVERLGEQRELNVLPGISVVKDEHAKEAKPAELMASVARSYPGEASTRLNAYILAKLENLLQTRYLRFKLIDDKTVAEARAAAVTATGRKSKFGKKGGLEALVAAGVMMKGTLLAIGMGALALMAGKALMTALMALALSGMLGLKSLASGGGKSTTYEIVAKPIYTSSHSHSMSHEDAHGHGGHMAHSGGASGYGSYARSLNLQQPSDYKKTR